MNEDPGLDRRSSLRDPLGHVFERNGRIFRRLSAEGAAMHARVAANPFYGRLIADQRLANTWAADEPDVLEHERVPFISYPYEWPFELLRAAALHHLRLQIDCLEHGLVLRDASAYNVQFTGVRPRFIDVLSLKPYSPGELWTGHRQFCEEFLNPLLLTAAFAIPHHAWYGGRLEGIPADELSRLLPWWTWLFPRHLIHCHLPALAQRRASGASETELREIARQVLPRKKYSSLLEHLRGWIEDLEAGAAPASPWTDYASARALRAQELESKRRWVAEFARKTKPAMLWDLGCNDGEFSQTALENGAGRAVGFDADPGALSKAYARAAAGRLELTPLRQDLSDPSSGRGWRNRERGSLRSRGTPDAVLALAVGHHLALGRNIPLAEVVDEIVDTAPRGIVEFVEKTDPAAVKLLTLKGDVFRDYSKDAFESRLGGKARIVRTETISSEGRTLYWFER